MYKKFLSHYISKNNKNINIIFILNNLILQKILINLYIFQ